MQKIIVCGINGAGKSTLGKSLANALGYKFLDIEEYYFPANDTDYPYEIARTGEEVSHLLLDDMNKYDNLVLAAVKNSYGDEVESMFTCAVFINIPKNVSIKRVYNRAFEKLGNRILPDGDLYEKQKPFFEMVENRSVQYVEDWLRSINIPILRIDGTKSIEHNVETVLQLLKL